MKVAEQSPRICRDGSIRWYQGDTFVLTFEFKLKDVNGNLIEFLPTDKIELFLKNYKNEQMAMFVSVGSNAIDFNIDEETSKRLQEGVYNLDVRFNGDFITTLMKNNKVVIE